MYSTADLFIIMIIEQLFSNRQNNFHYYYLKVYSQNEYITIQEVKASSNEVKRFLLGEFFFWLYRIYLYDYVCPAWFPLSLDEFLISLTFLNLWLDLRLLILLKLIV